MKFSVSTYSFFQLISKGELDSFGAIEKAAELGFDAIEFVDFVDFNMPEEERPAFAEKLRAAAEKAGLEISSLTIGADFLNGCDGDTEAEIARVKRYVDIGRVLGVKRMRHDATVGYPRDSGKYVSFDAVLPRLAAACRAVTEYAAQFGIMTMSENHGFFAQDSERVEKLCNAVGSPNYRLLGDMGNFLCADEDPAAAFARVAPYLGYVHAKDFIVKPFDACDPGEGAFRSRGGNFLRGTVIGHGQVPVKHCLYLAKAAGYDGYVSIEFEGMEPPVTAVRIGLANLKRYVSEI